MKVIVDITSESRFPINRKIIRNAVQQYITLHKLRSDVVVEVAVVGDRKMHSLNKTYRQLDTTTTLLSFGYEDPHRATTFVEPPDNILRLGSIVISYPQAVRRAGEDGMMVDDKFSQLIEHGMKNLLNID